MNGVKDFKKWFVNLNESSMDDIIYFYDELYFFHTFWL